MATNNEFSDEFEQLYIGLPNNTEPMSVGSEETLAEFLKGPLPERKKWFLRKVYLDLGGIDPEDIETASAILAVRSGSLVTAEEVRPKLTQAVVVVQRDTALDRMNARFFVIKNEGGKCLVGEWNKTDIGSAITWQLPREFMIAYLGQKVFAGRNVNGPVYKPIGKFWIEHSGRKEFDEIGFNPRADSSYEEGGLYKLNLWRGWGISFKGFAAPDGKLLETAMMYSPPPKGSDRWKEELTGEKWPKLKYHIETVLAGGDPVAAAYIIKWAAWSFQNIDEPSGAAICFRGKQGTGKGTFGKMMKTIFGKAARHITRESDVSGRFNGIFRGVCLAFFDEAIYPKARASQSALKGMLTEPTLQYESKGRDQIEGKNMIKVIMATNHDWVVPVEGEDRRFAVFDVSDIHMQDRTYFGDLNKALYKDGEAAQFVYECLHYDLKGWHPEKDIPNTKARREQKVNALGDEKLLIHTMLNGGEVPHTFPIMRSTDEDIAWMPSSYIEELCDKYNVRLNSKPLAEMLKELGFEKRKTYNKVDGKSVQTRGYVLPRLSEARRKWVEMGNPEFNEDDELSPQDEMDDPSRGWTVPMEPKF